MTTLPSTPPSGFRDYSPEACALRARAIETISRVYRDFGFSQIATSAVEDLAVLSGKAAGENEKLIFKILKRGEKLELAQGTGELADLGLRFDLTLPLARYYNRHQSQLPHPFKAFHIGPVWRAERPQKGRYREFYQCDVDIVGTDHVQGEIDVLSAAVSALDALGVSAPAVLLNDRRMLFALFNEAKIPEEKRGQACILLDKLDKAELKALLAEMDLLLGAEATKFLESHVLAAEPDLDRLSHVAPEPMVRLSELLRHLSALFGKEKFRVSPSLVRGLDYYTGCVFEFRHPGLSGSLGGGGRYDRLTEKFGGPSIPACGASIGFERLMLLLEESGAAGKEPGPQVCVTVFSEELRARTLEAAASLRQAGVSADVYPGSGKLKAQFKYADAKKAALALVMGPDEAAAGKVTVKDLKTGEERLETVASLIARLKPSATPKARG